jgi:hypothetical protein
VGKRDRKTGTQLIKKKSQETELVVHLTSRKHKRKCHGLGKKNIMQSGDRMGAETKILRTSIESDGAHSRNAEARPQEQITEDRDRLGIKETR